MRSWFWKAALRLPAPVCQEHCRDAALGEGLSMWDPKQPVQASVEEEEFVIPGIEELSALHHTR